jgi:endoglucanase
MGKYYYKYFLISLIFLVSACGVVQKNSSEAGEVNSAARGLTPLTVYQNKIVDSNGQEVQLKGISLTDVLLLSRGIDTGSGLWDKAVFLELKSWGADIVRLPIHPKYWQDS